MSLRIAHSPRAAVEIDEITAFLGGQNPAAARRFVTSLGEAQRQLAEFPNSGERGVIPGTRRAVVGNYLVHYRRRGDDLEIFAVRDARRRDSRVPR